MNSLSIQLHCPFVQKNLEDFALLMYSILSVCSKCIYLPGCVRTLLEISVQVHYFVYLKKKKKKRGGHYFFGRLSTHCVNSIVMFEGAFDMELKPY